MADNITLPGTGIIVATETVSAAEVQRVKPGWGAVDTFTEIDTGTPLPVVQTGTPALPSGAATQATLAAVLAILATTLSVGDASAEARLASLITLVNGGLPAALAANGGLKVEGVAGGVAQPVSVAGTLSTTSVPATSGGLSVFRSISLIGSGGAVKASAGQLYGWYIVNNATTVRFVKIYDKASAPVPGTDTPLMTLEIPASATGAGTNVFIAAGIQFSNGIAIYGCNLVADSDTTAPSANDLVVNLWYK